MSKREEAGRKILRGIFRTVRTTVNLTAGTVLEVGKGVVKEAYDQTAPAVAEAGRKLDEFTKGDEEEKGHEENPD
jgi:hypothetical protein